MKIGQIGENTAERYLTRRNYIILKKNYRCKAGEIDIIAKSGNTVVFVEVKTRNTLKYGHPSESVTRTKIKHLTRAANWYLACNDFNDPDEEYRFDIIEILRKNNKTYINHIENAF